LVVERIASLKEIETYYDLVEVFDAHEALDLKYEADAKSMETE
jgi:hypothetical protein